LKAKIKRCAETLLNHQVIAVAGNSVESIFQKHPRNACWLQFHRGAYFTSNRQTRKSPGKGDSPLRDPLKAIGFDQRTIARILHQYSAKQIQLWADVTLAAMERKGPDFFRHSPQAFFMDNIKNAAQAGRTPPDWFWAIRKEEDRRRAKLARRTKQSRNRCGDVGPARLVLPSRAFPPNTATAAIVTEMTAQFLAAGQSTADAQRNAERFAADYANRNPARASS
jgi:hypothetical protein